MSGGLEAPRRAGIVERQAEGIWKITADLVAQGHAFDRQRTGGVDVQLHSHLPIEKQVAALGATWLDQRLVSDDARDRQRWLWRGRKGGTT